MHENCPLMKNTGENNRKNSQRRDLLIAFCTVALTYFLSIILDPAEHFMEWAEPLEHGQIDELPFVFLAAAIVAIWFSSRRMRELSIEIATRREAEKKAHESLVRFQTLFEEGLSGNFIADKYGNLIICNKAFRHMSGMAVRGEDQFNIASALGGKWQSIARDSSQSAYLDFPELILERPDKGVWVVMARFRLVLSETAEIQEVHGYFTDITEQYLAEKELSQLFAENRALTGHAMQAQEEERCRLAREIHDDVGQYLTAIRLDAATIPNMNDRASASVYLERIAKHAEYIQVAIRRIIRRLRPAALDAHGLIEAIQQLVHDWCNQNPEINCSMDLDESCNRLPETISIVIFRIIQEALTNISRHAQARHVDIYLKHKNQGLFIRIKDDGLGIKSPSVTPNSFGLTGMRERIESLHGSFALTSRPNAGVAITAIIPFNHLRECDYVENTVG